MCLCIYVACKSASTFMSKCVDRLHTTSGLELYITLFATTCIYMYMQMWYVTLCDVHHDTFMALSWCATHPNSCGQGYNSLS